VRRHRAQRGFSSQHIIDGLLGAALFEGAFAASRRDAFASRMRMAPRRPFPSGTAKRPDERSSFRKRSGDCANGSRK